MRWGGRRSALWASVGIVLLMLVPPGIAATSGPPGHASTPQRTPVVLDSSDYAARFAAEPRAVIADEEPGLALAGAVALGPTIDPDVEVLLTLPFSNDSALGTFLTALNDRSSASYHHYLTAAAFDRTFGGSPAAYASLADYLRSFPGAAVTSYGTRTTIAVSAPASSIDRAFDVDLENYELDGRPYFAPTSAPSLPESLASQVIGIEGLSSYSHYLTGTGLTTTEHRVPTSPHRPAPPVAGYLAPYTSGGVQYEYAPDLQVTYDEQSLFDEYGYPNGSVVATILWGGVYSGANITTPYGNLTTGEAVGGFDPSDISAYYNETIPAFEPHAHVFGVPLSGAAAPGPLASYDTSGALDENTLDLEMVGSLAPGANVYNVYGPDASSVNLDSAFSFILSPNASFTGLGNVSVITNSWGGPEYNNSAWYSDLQTAQARGITVLASSGDSADDNASPKWAGSGTDPLEWPAAMAYDTFGDVAVGGTTITIDASSFQLTNNSAWYDTTPSSDVVGSVGGISSVFAEPSWQNASPFANALLAGAGRGVPDLAAIANNTLVTLSINGHTYNATNATHGGVYYFDSGTSVASPVEAGIVDEIDYVLHAGHNGWLGFLDPSLYALEDQQYGSLAGNLNGSIGFYPTGSYASPLPTLPVDVAPYGGNARYGATQNYSLVTGWGSLDAYNYTTYFLDLSWNGVRGALDGVDDSLDLSGLNVYSSGVTYNASFQQNFFLADALGAPIYWIQNVLYIQNLGVNSWGAYYSGWNVFPFYGQYPYQVDYEYNYPGTWNNWTFPQPLNVSTNLTVPSGPDSANITFSVGNDTLSLPAPGAAYIIGDLWYNYSWQGSEYENGPYAPNSIPGGLSPQFGLVGGPSGGTGIYSAPTGGSIAAYVRPSGTGHWVAPASMAYGYSVTQTGESAYGVQYSRAGGTTNDWTVGLRSGSNEQGVLSYVPVTSTQRFNESGLPAGTKWDLNVTNASGVVFSGTSTTRSIVLDLANGNYHYVATSLTPGYTTLHATINVNGTGRNRTLNFASLGPLVYFNETGIPSYAFGTGATWALNLTGTNYTLAETVSASSFSTNLAPGAYNFTAKSNDAVWRVVVNASGSITVGATSFGVNIGFVQVTYTVAFFETGLPAGTTWYVNGTNGTGGSFAVASNEPYDNGTSSNGTFNYTIRNADPLYTASPPSGSEDVAGANRTVDIEFLLATYVVNVTEIGLAPGVEWWANVTSEPPRSTTNRSVSISVANGTYSVNFGVGDPRWAAPGTIGPFTVNGVGANVFAEFEPVNFVVNVAEAGLPAGTLWYANMTGPFGPVPLASMTGTAVADVQNGSYLVTFVSSDPLYQAAERTQNFSIAGATYDLSVTFVLVTYAAVVNESGLPSGAEWTITGSGPEGPWTNTSSTASNELTLPNGSYTYHLSVSIEGWIGSPPNGTFSVTGASRTLSVSFVRLTYAVTFHASGLPSTLAWYVNFTNGLEVNFTGSGGVVDLPNGSFVYTVQSGDLEYAPNATSGTVDVNAGPASAEVGFREITYTVTFSETGLAAGTSWSVTFNGTTSPSSSVELTFATVPNGSYAYTVNTVQGFIATPLSGILHVTGSNTGVSVAFDPVSTPPPSGGSNSSVSLTSGDTLYIVGGIAAFVIVAALVGVLLFGRRPKSGTGEGGTEPAAEPPVDGGPGSG
jgi:Pro-kumamolisin, activation domain/Subtilase family